MSTPSRTSRLLFLILLPATLGADPLAARVQETYQETAVLRGEFVQSTYVALLEKTVKEEGTLLFARPNRFVIHYLGPRERKYISDGRRLWIWRRDGHEIEEVGRLQEAVSREALAFLGGLGEMEREFHVREVSEKGTPTLHLQPRDPASPFKRIILNIDPDSYLAREARLYPKSGNESRYEFRHLSQERKVSPYEFRPPRGGKR